MKTTLKSLSLSALEINCFNFTIFHVHISTSPPHVLGLREAGADTAAAYDTWTNGMAVEFSDWLENQPSSAEEECVVMDAENNYQFNDILCSAPTAFVCKVEPVCPLGKA